jgi:DNA-binding transcriptional ArsR family regulator
VQQQLSIDRVFSALADPSRRAIIERLCQSSASVSTLAKPLDMTLAAVVQHVQQLEASGLITTAKIGRVRTCRLRTETLQAVETWLRERRTLWERRFDRLGVLLEEDAQTK